MRSSLSTPRWLTLSLSALLPFLRPRAPAATSQSLSIHQRSQPLLRNEILEREARWTRMTRISLTGLRWRSGVHGWPKRTRPHAPAAVVSSANCAGSGAITLIIWSAIWGKLIMVASSCHAWLIHAREILLERTPWNDISRISTIGISRTRSGTRGWWSKGPHRHEVTIAFARSIILSYTNKYRHWHHAHMDMSTTPNHWLYYIYAHYLSSPNVCPTDLSNNYAQSMTFMISIVWKVAWTLMHRAPTLATLGLGRSVKRTHPQACVYPLSHATYFLELRK